METNMSTTIEESVRKLRGIRYILSCLSYPDDLDTDQADMYELLAMTIDDIANDLEPLAKSCFDI